MTTTLLKRPGLYNAKGIRASALESPPAPIYFCFTEQEAKHLLDFELPACAPQDGADWPTMRFDALWSRAAYST